MFPRPRLLKKCLAKLRGVFDWQSLIGVREGTQTSHVSCERCDSVRSCIAFSNIASALVASILDAKLPESDQLFGMRSQVPVSAGDLGKFGQHVVSHSLERRDLCDNAKVPDGEKMQPLSRKPRSRS